MTDDLKLIKKLYGEAMMHFCRDSFSTILENKGKLPEILQSLFAPSHVLYEDLKNSKLLINFKNYIYNSFSKKDEEIESLEIPIPQELMKQAGYILYECKTEKDIQAFKKYYARGEELCTFNGGRLNRCYVFFAVKENVDKIKRKSFSNPKRQDEYGTSVISIQFSRDRFHTLSIKNRYNHTVENPDATFSNNLDNIIKGLTKSFEHTYGLMQKHKNDGFEIPGYVRANDGRWYKYNYEINNIYYCPDNIIIDNGAVKRFDKEKYIIMDYFILDLTQKTITLYSNFIPETFQDIVGKIKKITVVRKGEEKKVTIIDENDEETIIIINKNNQIIGLKCGSIKQIGNNFLYNNKSLKNLNLPNLQQIGDNCLFDNNCLTSLEMPNLEKVGNGFLYSNNSLMSLELLRLQQVGDNFLDNNDVLSSVILPKLQQVGRNFLNYNRNITKLSLPSLEQAGDAFLSHNPYLKFVELPNLKIVENFFLCNNVLLAALDLPSLQQVGDDFLYFNHSIKSVKLPNLQQVGDGFLFGNSSLETLTLPNLQKAGNKFMVGNSSLIKLELPALQQVGKMFLPYNKRASVGLLKYMLARIHYEYLNILKKYNSNQMYEIGQGRK